MGRRGCPGANEKRPLSNSYSSRQLIKPLPAKGQLGPGGRNSILRNGLVIFQFTTSICLIIGTIVVYTQTKYILNTKVGFDKDQVLLIQGPNTLGGKREAFKNELLKSSTIKSISVSDYLPISGTKRDGNTFFNQGKKKEEAGVFAQKWAIDHAYLNTMGMHILQGRYFSKEITSDSEATVINEAMAAKLGLKDPIGKQIENGWQKFTVIGVVEDFNFESMKQSVNPLCLVLANYNSSIYRRSYRILGNVEMAAGFRLPHFHKLVDDRYCRFCRRNNCPVYNMFSFN